jgi:hypothetical protein
MDSDYTLWLDDIINDALGKTGGRRSGSEGPGYSIRPAMPQDVGFNEDTGDDIGRRERMAQAMYDC